MGEKKDSSSRIQELRKKFEQLEGDILSAAIMDDEGMGEGDEGLRKLWTLIMMYGFRFIKYNKYTTLMGDVDNGRGYVSVVGEGIQEKSLYFFSI